MKIIYVVFLLITHIKLIGQVLPSDSIILKEVLGKTDKGGLTYSRPFDKEKEEEFNADEGEIVWKIVFKDNVYLQSQDFLFVIIEGEDFTQHGHQFGYRNMYFFNQINGKIKLVDSITGDDEIGLGDNNSYEIVDIGKEKKALIIQFGSSGNQHYESSRSINLLEVGNLTYILSTKSYDNSVWKMPEVDEEDCQASKYDEDYEIIKNEKEWYDIKIHHMDYGFTKGCKESFVKLESDKIYIYTDGKYKENKQ
jgi:hypothetical protein